MMLTISYDHSAIKKLILKIIFAYDYSSAHTFFIGFDGRQIKVANFMTIYFAHKTSKTHL